MFFNYNGLDGCLIFSPQAVGGQNSGPPQQTYYWGSWLFSYSLFFLLAEVHPLEKTFDFDSKKNEAK